MKKLQEFFKKLWVLITNPMIGVLPGQIAFFLVLSVFPILIFVGVIASFFSVSMDTIIDAIGTTFSKDVVDIVVPFLSGNGFDTKIGVSMITGLILAGNGAHSVIIASNTLYGFKNADVVRRRVKAAFIIMLMIILFVFTLFVLAFGDIIIKQILSIVDDNSLLADIYTLMPLRWPLAMFIMFFNIKLIYTLTPDGKVYSKYTTKGALFTTSGWVVATAIYSYYVSHFSNYDIYYGGLSSIVVLMIWIYVISYILVIGIAINANEYKIGEKKE